MYKLLVVPQAARVFAAVADIPPAVGNQGYYII